MGRHKYRSSFRKSENDIAQNGDGLFDVASTFAKNLTKKAAESVAEAALKKGAKKLSEKAAESVGRKLRGKVFRKTSRQKPVSSTKITSGLSEARVEDLY